MSAGGKLVKLLLSVTLVVVSWSLPAVSQTQNLVYPPYALNNDTLLYLQAVKFVVKSQSATNPKVSLMFDAAPTIESSVSDSNVTISVTYPDGKNEKISVTGFSFQLTIVSKGGYMTLADAKLSSKATVSGEPELAYSNSKIISNMQLSAPLKMSFHCGRFGPLSPPSPKLHKPNATASIELIDFQIQTFMKDNSKFSRSYDCVGFFSIGILAGWFVTIILLGLLSWGVQMLMNVHTMDRFDDPKGKSITINATD